MENTAGKTVLVGVLRRARDPGLLAAFRERAMGSEIQLISDGSGLAVIGDPAVVDGFLVCEGLASRDLGLPRLGAILGAGAAAAQAGSEIAAASGRWVKLTKE